mmetsp:Transcript_4501/g.13651  ORF Transcript_4501/g.13651 Transcript_4501/m.13651 type:complete len:454 (+) Transcript_4501:131-1492(+)
MRQGSKSMGRPIKSAVSAPSAPSAPSASSSSSKSSRRGAETAARRGFVLRRGDDKGAILPGGVSKPDEHRKRLLERTWKYLSRSLETLWKDRGRTDRGFLTLLAVGCFLLIWTMYDIRHDDHVGAFSSLPYPFSLAAEVRGREGLTWGTSQENPVAFPPGYAEVRPGTYRDVDTSGESRSKPHRYGSFDEIFVITNEKCGAQTVEFEKRAAAANVKFSKVPLNVKGISLDHPEIQILSHRSPPTLNSAQRALLKINVAYTLANRCIWERMISKKLQRVLVIDDVFFLKERIASVLPDLFGWVDQESVGGQNPWHILFFRRKTLEEDWAGHNESMWEGSEGTWSRNPKYGYTVVRAKPSYSGGVYALSIQGARWLLKHMHAYEAPFDVQISELQKKYPQEFVALSACNSNELKSFCQDTVDEVLTSSASSSTSDCNWRKTQERKLLSSSESEAT